MHGKPITWADNKKLTVINFLSGPGCGKSTTAAELFALMKKENMKVELIHEIAKDYVWEQWGHIFREQDWIFAHQHRLQRRLVSHDIDYVILDSSMLLSMFYTPDDFPPSFKPFVKDVYDSYTNINIYLERNIAFDYVEQGRNHTVAEAIELDKQVLSYLEENTIPLHKVIGGGSAALEVLKIVKSLRILPQ